MRRSESRERWRSKSDVVRARLSTAAKPRSRRAAGIGDLVGSVGALPADLSGRRKGYLKKKGYGRKRSSAPDP
jgi:hypothetical protein